MTSQTVQQRAREAQSQHFDAEGFPPDALLRTLTSTLYDNVDALNTERTTILLMEAIGTVQGMLRAIAAGSNDRVLAAESFNLSALLAVASYALEVEREKAGFTSTSDKRVDDILDGVHEMLAEQALAGMTEEERDLAKRMKEEVKRRVAQGDDFETAVTEEAEKAGLHRHSGHQHTHGHRDADTVAPAPSKDDDFRATGLYL